MKEFNYALKHREQRQQILIMKCYLQTFIKYYSGEVLEQAFDKKEWIYSQEKIRDKECR